MARQLISCFIIFFFTVRIVAQSKEHICRCLVFTRIKNEYGHLVSGLKSEGGAVFIIEAFKQLKGDNKELLIIPGAVHTDLYDRKDIIPFDKIQRFFEENLK